MTMFLKEKRISLVIIASFIVALLLTFLCLPIYFEWMCPEWLGLVALYWIYVMPKHVNTGIAFMVGFLLDILYNTPMGEHAFILVLMAYFITKFSKKIELLKFWRIPVMVFGIVLLYQMLLLLPQIYLGRHLDVWSVLGRVIVSALLWLVMTTLFDYQRHKIHFEKYY